MLDKGEKLRGIFNHRDTARHSEENRNQNALKALTTD